jgi:predicted metal-binding membrane protein
LSGSAALTGALQRQRVIVVGALLLITGLAWIWLFRLGAQMSTLPTPDMAGMDMSNMDANAMAAMSTMAPALEPWTLTHGLFLFAMWAVMMVGMMTPSVAPMVFIYQRVAQQAHSSGHSFAPASWFFGGYLAAWTVFAALATLAQWALESAALLTPMMDSASNRFGGVVLLAAGLYQWLPLKDACLAHCRAPLSFVQQHGGFQAGAGGSMRLGFVHGLYCIGCCWTLMALLFVGGVMNLLWIAALMILVLLEKILPGGRWLSRVAGLVMVGAGAWLITLG